MASDAFDLAVDPILIEIEAEEAFSPQASRAFVEELLARPASRESMGTAEDLRHIRADADPEE